jgi:hypothetical protein
VQIDRFPERVVSRPECAVVHVKLVREDELQFLSLVGIRPDAIRLLRSIGVYYTELASCDRYLACRIDTSKIETTQFGKVVADEKDGQWVACKQADEGDADDDKAAEIGETSDGENGASLVILPVSPGIGVVQKVIRFCF